MNVKEAVRNARTSFADLFADDLIHDIGLEEVEYDDEAKVWHVTIGFYRDSDVGVSGFSLGSRYYRTLQIDDATGELVSVTIRQVAA